MSAAAYADTHQGERQVQNIAGGGAMDVAPVRVAAPGESVVTQNHHSLDRVHGATASEQKIEQPLIGHRPWLHRRGIQAVPRTPGLERDAKHLLSKDLRGMLVLGVVELDSRAVLPNEPRPYREPWARQAEDPTPGFR